MKILFSYAPADRDVASALAVELEKLGYETFLADRDVYPGDNHFRVISEALEQSDAMVVLISPAGVRDQNLRHNLSFAVGSGRYANRVIPVEVHETDSKDIPWVLSNMRQLVTKGTARTQALAISGELRPAARTRAGA